MAQDLQDERDGPFWIVVGFQLPRAVLVHRRWNERRERQREVLEAFYAALSGRSVTAGQGGAHPPRWRDAAYPTQMYLGVQRIPHHQPPRWPDPDYPAQMHLDIAFRDRIPKERLALDLGGTRLPPQGGSCPGRIQLVVATPRDHGGVRWGVAGSSWR